MFRIRSSSNKKLNPYSKSSSPLLERIKRALTPAKREAESGKTGGRRQNHLLKKKIPPWRAHAVIAGVCVLMASLFVRSFYVQVVHSDFYQAKGASRYERTVVIPGERGRILDRNGEILAASAPSKAIWAIPEEVRADVSQERRLAEILDMSAEELSRRLSIKTSFVYLKRQVELDVAQKVKELGLAGIYEMAEPKRYYPSGGMLAHVIGFTGSDGTGQEGMELKYESVLAPSDGKRMVMRDRKGRTVEQIAHLADPVHGKDVVLSIDSRIQHLATEALKEAVEKHNAKAGGVIVIDSQSGEILALANLPNYDPNDRRNLSGEQLRNRVFTDTYEPGSIMKPFPIALALENGLVRPTTMIETSAGAMKIGKHTIKDAHRSDDLTVGGVIQKSSNIGTVKIAMQLTPKQMWTLYDRLGFGRPIDMGFPGEAKGRMRHYDTWKPIEQATMSYGHGISTSLVQMARAYMAFTRKEGMIPLSLVKRAEIPEGDRIFSEKTVDEMRAMMEKVGQKGGTATRAQIHGYSIAGKTGTSTKLIGGRYSSTYVASFVGYAPAKDPKLIVAVMVDEPRANGYYGGVVAAPVFAGIASPALRILGVQPDMPLHIKDASVLETLKAEEAGGEEGGLQGKAFAQPSPIRLTKPVERAADNERIQGKQTKPNQAAATKPVAERSTERSAEGRAIRQQSEQQLIEIINRN